VKIFTVQFEFGFGTKNIYNHEKIHIPFCNNCIGIFCLQKLNSRLKIDKDAYYTCSMHPQVMQDKPGTCPICQWI
jgi:hypothetical protein